METICDIPVEDLPFSIFNLCLQEPMALLWNTLIAVACFYSFYKIKDHNMPFFKQWRLFFLLMGISMFLGGFSHLFFQYSGMYGKMFTWVFAFFSAFYIGKAMLSLNLINDGVKRFLNALLYIKFVVLLSIAIYTENFIFVTVDASITYLVYCLGLGLNYKRKELKSFKYTVLGVLLLVPSIFIFIFEISPSIWFNKNDLSHALIIGTILFFYLGVKNFDEEKWLVLSELRKEND